MAKLVMRVRLDPLMGFLRAQGLRGQAEWVHLGGVRQERREGKIWLYTCD